jgi:hypothetical protein
VARAIVVREGPCEGVVEAMLDKGDVEILSMCFSSIVGDEVNCVGAQEEYRWSDEESC